MIKKKSKIFVAGHKGMVGNAIKQELINKEYKNLITVNKSDLNLLDQTKVFKFLKKNKPDLVIIAAARVGGVHANSKYKDKFIYENLQIQNNLIHGSYLAKIKNLIFLGSSCIYPKFAKQPMKEEYLLSGKLEETNDAYAIAKIAGIKMCEEYSKNKNLNYKSIMPPNLYGPGDSYDLDNSHFYSAILKKIYLAKKNKLNFIEVWGSGKPRRELMYVGDLADAVLFFLNRKIKQPFVNVGTGKDYKISWYVNFLMKKFNIKLKIKYIKSKPDGMPRKCMDIKLVKKYGWKSKFDLNKGFELTYKDFLKNYDSKRK